MSVKEIILFVVIVLFQVLFFNYFVILNIATPFVFILPLLMLPKSIKPVYQLILAFFVALIVDSFTGNIGMQTFSAVLLVGTKFVWLKVISSNLTGDEKNFPINTQNYAWFFSYLIPLTFLNHLTYFLVEAFGFQNFHITLLKVITSTLYTFVFMMIIVAIFYKKQEE